MSFKLILKRTTKLKVILFSYKMPFTHLEKCDMLEMYLVCRKQADRAVQEYVQLFPERVVPNRRYFLVLYRKFRSNESVFEKARTKKPFIINEEIEINVLAYFEAHKENSIRDLVSDSNLSLITIWRILKKHKFIPYKYRRVQTLMPGDTERRLAFCHWLLNTYNVNNNILKYIFWSDEAKFSNRGMVNRKNRHYWSKENLFLADPRNPQVQFAINVWCGIIGSNIVGPIFYEGSLTGRRYVDLIITGVLEEYMDNVNLEIRHLIYFQQDGAPPHQVQEVGTLLNRMFPGRWIANNGPIHWPARSPDLSPLDFFFWSYIKDELYKKKYRNIEELQMNIRRIIASIDGRTVAKSTKHVIKCARKCIEQNGDVFEHLM